MDQKAIWTSPFLLQAEAVRWLAPIGAATAALIDERLANSVSGSMSSCAEDFSMSSGSSSSIHVFVESYDFPIIYCEHMRKVASELPTSRFNTPGIMTQSHDFITLSDKLSWIKMLNLLSIN